MPLFSSRWLKISISLGLFAWLLHQTDLSLFHDRLASVQPGWLAVAFLGYLLSQVVSAFKWRVLAGPLGFHQPLLAFVSYYFAGMYLNLFAPSTVAGDFGRSVLLAQEKGRLGAAVQSVIADRITGLVMLLWVGTVGAIVVNVASVPGLWRLGVAAGAVGATLGWRLLPQMLEWFFRRETRMRRRLEQFVGPYQNASPTLLRACGLSLVFHLLQLSLQVLLAEALQIEVSFRYLLFCLPLINILSNLPISFSGFGVREGSCMLLFSLVGIATERALAFGLLWGALTVGANATGGLVLLLSPTGRRSLTEIKRTPDE